MEFKQCLKALISIALLIVVIILVAPRTVHNSGIKGIVTTDPLCPGPATNPRICTEERRPYKVSIKASLKGGEYSKAFSSNAEGKFEVQLPPGEYVLSRAAECDYVNCSEPSPDIVTVKKDQYTQLDLHFYRSFDEAEIL